MFCFLENSYGMKIKLNFQENRAKLEKMDDGAPPQKDILHFCS